MEKKMSTVSRVSNLIIEKPPGVFGVRHLEVALLFLCMLFAYILRVNISVAVVAMTSPTPHEDDPVYDWDTYTKGLILSAFFWGYLVMNIPAAVIGHSVNNKRLLGGTFAIASVLSIATPLLVQWGGASIMIAIRICQGLAQGFMMPMIHGLLSKWAPPQERARLATYILGGMQFGTMLVLGTSGYIATHVGWPLIFYISGLLGLVWVVLWMWLGANSPEAHPFISKQEKTFIQRSLPETARDNTKMKIPWKGIWTSGPQYAVTLAHIGQNWGMWTINTEIPAYFNHALKYDLSAGGFIQAMPFLLMWIVSFPLACIADRLIIKGYTSINMSRKIWNTVAHWGGAIALLGVAFAGDNTTLAITLYTVAVTLNCCIFMGFNVNHLDLAPNFARILMGISNGCANVTSIIAPIFAGAVVTNENDVNQWRWVFIASAVSYFLGNLAFITLGSGDLQPWNDPEYRKKKKEENGLSSSPCESKEVSKDTA